MANTTNITVLNSDGWTEVADLTGPITVKQNGPWRWYVAQTDTGSEPTGQGEVHQGGHEPYISNVEASKVWVKTDGPSADFAVTV